MTKISILTEPLNVCSHPDCTTIVCGINKRSKRWLNYCSKSCERKHVLIKTRITCLERYGVDNPAKNKTTISKMIDTISKRSDMDKTRIRLKHEESCLKNHGVKYTFHSASIKSKRKNTFIEKYGVDHYSKSEEFKTFMAESQQSYTNEKWETINTNRQNTCLEKYGVDNPAKVPEIHSKKMRTAATSKNYTLPSGRIVTIQGWENKALDDLLLTYSEYDICYDTSTIPTICYTGTDGKQHKYYPDFYIPKDNLIIEVKSTYTYSGKKNWFDSNLLKEQACKDAGYNFRFMIY
jgi:hypothetical protein